jgi:hypothetical protein
MELCLLRLSDDDVQKREDEAPAYILCVTPYFRPHTMSPGALQHHAEKQTASRASFVSPMTCT